MQNHDSNNLFLICQAIALYSWRKKLLRLLISFFGIFMLFKFVLEAAILTIWGNFSFLLTIL